MARGSKTGAGGRTGGGPGAGGASSGAIRAGGAFVELFSKDDKLQKGLKDASGKLKLWAESLKRAGTGEALGGALTSPMAAAAAAAGVIFKAAFNDFVLNQGVMRQEVERTSDLTGRWLENFSADLDKVRQRVADFQNELGTGSGMTKLETELTAAQKNLEGLRASLAEARKAYESYNEVFSSTQNISLYASAPLTGGLAGEQEKLKPALDAANKAYQEQLKLITELTRKKNELLDPSKNPAALKAIRDFTESLNEDVAKLTSSVSDRERSFQKLANQFGFGPSNAEWQQAMDAVKKADVAEAVENFTKAVNEQTDRIENAHLDDNEFQFKKLAEKMDWGPANPEWQRGMEALKNNRIADAVEAAQHWVENWDPPSMSPGTRGTFNAGNYAQFFGGGGVMGDIKKLSEEQNELTRQLLAALKSVPLARL